MNRAEVGLATVDEQQVRPFFLAFCPTYDDFFHHPKVIKGLTLDDVFSVLFFGRSPFAHDNACSHALIALQLRHVKTNDVVELLHPKGFRAFIRRPLFERAAGFCCHSLKLNLGVLPSEGGEVFQIAALRYADFYRGAPPFVQPGLETVKDGNRREKQAWWGPMSIVLGDEHRHGFADVAPVHGRPRFLALDDAFVSVQDHDSSEVAFGHDADGIAVAIDLA